MMKPEPSPRNETLGRSSCSHRRWTRRVSLAGVSEYKSGAVDCRNGCEATAGPAKRSEQPCKGGTALREKSAVKPEAPGVKSE
jgi:hypothetical protein